MHPSSHGYRKLDQRGFASLLLLSLLSAVLLLALASLVYQQQLALRSQGHEGRYSQWLVATENALQRAAWVLAAGANTPQPLADAEVSEQWALIDDNGHDDWPQDQIWQLCAQAGDGGAAVRLCQWWWRRPLLRQLPPGALWIGGLSPPLAVELASLDDLFAAGRQLWSPALQPLAPSSQLCLAAAFGDGLCLAEGGQPEIKPSVAQRPSLSLLGVDLASQEQAPLGAVTGNAEVATHCGPQLAVQAVLWWPGDCVLVAGSYGSASAPVLLLIKDGDLHLDAGAKLFGLVLLSRSSGASTVTQSPAALLQGAFVSDGAVQLGGGPLRLLYDPQLLAPLLTRQVAEALPGSWRDW